MDKMKNEIPELETKVEALQIELQTEKRKTWAYDTYKLVDNPEAPVSIFKSITPNFFIISGSTWLQIFRTKAIWFR